ncbi:hypothetical protein PVAND_012046 [Polypedilum vanderplanki]|uniref:DOMON domain-containing protein n=1 Tax=Polypedilum vanderplanki TaxID=319348 RepID=A0A9J6CL89_POLVA|nr:hypothetical protein PVAND_012046 [Polypedilum vanderplanki]
MIVVIALLMCLAVICDGKFHRHRVPNITPNQMHQITLDPVEKVKLTWMVDWPEKNVFFQVKNGINDKFSWFAVGFSRRGDFARTDFCIFQKEENDRIDTNIDAWSSKDGREIIIDRQQDCISIARTNKDEIAFRRKFDTCDEEDFNFHEGTMFIYWMRGEEPLDFVDESIPMPDLSEENFGMSHVQLLRADSISIPEK